MLRSTTFALAILAHLTCAEDIFAQAEAKSTAIATLNTVAAWKSALLEGEKDSRRQAALATFKLDPVTQAELVPVFIELLATEKDGQIRLAVFDTLTKLGPKAAKACPTLAHAMRENFGGRYNEEVHQDYRAALALASIGAEAVSTLRSLLVEDKANIRAEAAMALGRIGSEAQEAIPDLILLLSDEEERVRNDTREALSAMGDQAGFALLEVAGSDNSLARANALLAVKDLSSSNAKLLELMRVETLRALESEDASVIAAAVQALPSEGMNADQVQDLLLAQLVSSPAVVRKSAVQQFAERPGFIEGIETQLAELLLHPENEIAKAAADIFKFGKSSNCDLLLNTAGDSRARVSEVAACLASYGPQIRKDLIRCLDEGDNQQIQCAALALGLLRPVDEQTPQELAARLAEANVAMQPFFVAALAELGYRARTAVPGIRELREHTDPLVRRQVIEILFVASEHGERLVEDLVPMLADSNNSVKLAALNALRSVGPKAQSSLPHVIELLNSEDTSVQLAAAEMIASFPENAQPAVPKLIQLLQRSELESKLVAVKSLGELGASSRAAVPDLVELLQEDSADLRAAAIDSLAKLELDTATLRRPFLAGIVDSDSSVRYRVYSAIRRQRENAISLLPDLLPLLADENAKQTLPRLFDRLDEYKVDTATAGEIEKSVRQILDSASNPEESEEGDDLQAVLLASIEFLGRAEMPGEGLLALLQELTSHSNDELKQRATEALVSLRATLESNSNSGD